MGEMFNLNERLYHEGEPWSAARIERDKATCLRAAAPSIAVAFVSFVAAALLFLGGAWMLARRGRRARWIVLAVLGVGIVVSVVVLAAS